MLATYHNHTLWSDGYATVAQMVEAALSAGVEELGISDHFALQPQGKPVSWSMKAEQLDTYAADVLSPEHIQTVATRNGNMNIRLGLEVDWFPSMHEKIARHLQRLPLDYVIGSVHYIDDFRVDYGPAEWEKLSEKERWQIGLKYWQLVKSMAESGLYDIAAHLDLYKKFGMCPDVSDTDEAHAALDALAQAGMVVEINTSGWQKVCKDAYPSLSILQKCKRRNIPVMIGSDAHDPMRLLQFFNDGAKQLMEAGYTTVTGFEKRKRKQFPLIAGR